MTPDEAAEHAKCLELFSAQIADRFDVRMEFRCDYEEFSMVTFPSHSAERSALLRSLITNPEPLIVDAFAGVGGDSIALIADFPRCELFAVQPTDTPTTWARFSRLTHNLMQFNRKFRGDEYTAITVAAKFEEFVPTVRRTIDLLYMSPPWSWGMTGDIVDRIADVVNGMRTDVEWMVLMLKDELQFSSRRAFERFHWVRSLPVVVKERVSFYFHVFQRLDGL
jgi:hypothetical protein